MPCTCLHTLWVWVPRLIISVGLTMAVTITVADRYGKVRNWQRTHSCSVTVASVMCPGQSWWLSHCGHSAALNGLSVWEWSDATSSIGRYTANSINPAICRLSRCFILFYLGPLLQRWPNFSGANIRIFLHNCKYYKKKRKTSYKNQNEKNFVRKPKRKRKTLYENQKRKNPFLFFQWKGSTRAKRVLTAHRAINTEY